VIVAGLETGTNDYEALRAESHALKGTAAVVQLQRLAELAGLMESDLAEAAKTGQLRDNRIQQISDAAKALAPFAGRYAEVLFAVGLLGASLLAAAILPVTAAYVIAETFGFEKGIKHRPREAPVFVGVITTLIATGTIVALIPGIPVFKLLVGVQVVNGVLLPITLFFVWRLASNRKLMGEYANGRTFNILAGATVIATSTLSLLLLVVTFTGG